MWTFIGSECLFFGTPWYDGYAQTTTAWGLTPLQAQNLAGAILWVPASAIHVSAALSLLAAWLRETDRAVPSPSA